MRRLASAATVMIGLLAATPSFAWDRPHHGDGWGYRPAPAWQHRPPPPPYWHRPWHPAPAWSGWRHERPRHHHWRHRPDRWDRW